MRRRECVTCGPGDGKVRLEPEKGGGSAGEKEGRRGKDIDCDISL